MAQTSANTLQNDSFMNYGADSLSGLKIGLEAGAKRELQKRKRETLKRIEKAAVSKLADRFDLGDDFEDIVDEMDGPEAGKKVAQFGARTAFKVARAQAIKQAKAEAAARVAQKLATRGAVRLIATAFGATIVGLIVTYLIWTVQAIAGNLMGSKWIPRLGNLGDVMFWWELPIWALLSLFIFAALLLLLIVASISVIFSNPLIAIGIFGSVIVSAITGS